MLNFRKLENFLFLKLFGGEKVKSKQKREKRRYLSTTEEDYLVELLRFLERGIERVKTTELANLLEVKPATVTNMLDRLKRRKLVKYEKYHGVQLTKKGKILAAKILRRHRVAERFLVDVLGMDWAETHKEAHELEHAISDELLERFEGLISSIPVCPHGHHIPTKKGEIFHDCSQPLSDFMEGKEVRISRVSHDLEKDVKTLKKLEGLGLIPGIDVKIKQKSPGNGPIMLQTGNIKHRRTIAIDNKIASNIYAIPVRIKDLYTVKEASKDEKMSQ